MPKLTIEYCTKCHDGTLHNPGAGECIHNYVISNVFTESDLLQLKNSIIENIERREFSIKGTQYSGLVYSIDLYNMLNDVFDSLINGLDKDEVKNGN